MDEMKSQFGRYATSCCEYGLGVYGQFSNTNKPTWARQDSLANLKSANSVTISTGKGRVSNDIVTQHEQLHGGSIKSPISMLTEEHMLGKVMEADFSSQVIFSSDKLAMSAKETGVNSVSSVVSPFTSVPPQLIPTGAKPSTNGKITLPLNFVAPRLSPEPSFVSISNDHLFIAQLSSQRKAPVLLPLKTINSTWVPKPGLLNWYVATQTKVS